MTADLPYSSRRRWSRDFEAGIVVRGPALKSVQFGDRRHKTEAEPASRRAPRRVRAIEALKDRRQVPRIDARSVVLDRQANAAGQFVSGDGNSNAVGRMPERVVEQFAIVCVSNSLSPSIGNSASRRETIALEGASCSRASSRQLRTWESGLRKS